MESEPEMLTRLLACLWHSGRRFDPARIERDARRIARLTWQRRQVMFWYWSGCLHFLTKRYTRVFARRSGGKTSPSALFEDQLRVVDALAAGDMTKKEQVRSGYLYDALLSMDESLRRQEERESANK